ncbi:MAG: tRNA 2-thiouridine(34) synthase MnmA, partial [Steroidobacteraceae bacterium]
RRCCAELDIPLHRVSFAAEYRERVFAHFLAELRAGRTPNPDVLCNREIKFGLCLAYARRLGAARFATGHYARIGSGGRLLRAVDTAKDQSYFLHMLNSVALAGCDFPVGLLCKPEVRAIARERGLPVFAKRDSTGICFIGERPFGDFLESWLPGNPGPIETPDGQVIGGHQGLARYTLGQRSGLGVGGLKDRGPAPWFVAGKDLARNALVVVQGRDHAALHCAGLCAAAVHWVSGQPPAEAFECTAKLRYRQPDVRCAVQLSEDGAEVRFAERQPGAVPGQYAVFYRDQECLGGGVIDSLIIDAEESCRTASRHAASSPSVTAASSTTAWTRSRVTRWGACPTR